MTYVRYIDKTRDYYAKEGYDKAYQWAHFEEVPFTTLKKPLAECRLTLVSTSDIAVKSDNERERSLAEMFAGQVYSIPSSTPIENLFSQQEHFDKHATHLDDVDTYFPITRLHEAATEGRIKSVAPRLHGVCTAYSHRRTMEIDAPEILQRCEEDQVDACILTPI